MKLRKSHSSRTRALFPEECPTMSKEAERVQLDQGMILLTNMAAFAQLLDPGAAAPAPPLCRGAKVPPTPVLIERPCAE